jgi:hypothetical protein
MRTPAETLPLHPNPGFDVKKNAVSNMGFIFQSGVLGLENFLHGAIMLPGITPPLAEAQEPWMGELRSPSGLC